MPDTVPGTGIQQRTSLDHCRRAAGILEGRQTVPGFMLWITHGDIIHSVQGVECWGRPLSLRPSAGEVA